MDRYDFAEKLMKRKEETAERVVSLTADKQRAYDRSTDKLRDLVQRDMVMCDGGEVMMACPTVGEKVQVQNQPYTDDHIIDLCADIRDLERRCKQLQEEIAKYERRSAVQYLEALGCVMRTRDANG